MFFCDTTKYYASTAWINYLSIAMFFLPCVALLVAQGILKVRKQRWLNIIRGSSAGQGWPAWKASVAPGKGDPGLSRTGFIDKQGWSGTEWQLGEGLWSDTLRCSNSVVMMLCIYCIIWLQLAGCQSPFRECRFYHPSSLILIMDHIK